MLRRDLIKGMAAAGAATVIGTRGAAAQDGRQARAGVRHRANVWSAATAVDPIRYYDVGGANLDPATSTDDYYHTCGLYGFRSYDLRNWGSHGAAVEAAQGHRYFWACGPDHPVVNWSFWRDSGNFMVGFSDDPGVFPERLIPIIPINNRVTGIHDTATDNVWNMYEVAWVTYNPEDADGKIFYFSGEGSSTSGSTPIQHCQMLWRSDDLLTWVCKKVSHSATNHTGWTSFNTTRRIGAGNWVSHGLGNLTSFSGIFKWTSTNGIDYTIGAELDKYRKNDGTMYNYTEITSPPLAGVPTNTISDIQSHGVGDEFSIGGQRYFVAREDGAVWQPVEGNKPQYISLVPVDSDGNVLGSPAPTRLAGPFDGVFPGPSFYQGVPYLVEDGILHIYAAHGFPGHAGTSNNGFPFALQWANLGSGNGVTTTFSGRVSTAKPLRPYATTCSSRWGDAENVFHDNGQGVFVGSRIVSSSINYATGAVSVTFTSAPDNGQGVYVRYVENNSAYTGTTGLKEAGGGLNEQFIDYYTHVYDATAAAASAPVGVTASCSSGLVTISWYNALPHQNYRVLRGTTSAAQTVPVGGGSGNVTGLSVTDTPAAGAQYWYKIITLNASVEAGYRIVHCYASSASELANKHINRVIDDGGDKTKINVARLDQAITFLNARDWMRDLLFWASPDWGVKESGGRLVKIYCLGTTRLPRGGDLTFTTSTTTYNATGLNDTCGAFVNANNDSFGYFGGGRFNPIRRKRQITVAAMYERTQTAADITFVGLKTSNGNFEVNFGGTEQPGLSLSHNAGTSGTVEFKLKDDQYGLGVRQNTATVSASSADYNIAIGSYDGTSMVAYHNGAAGTANADYDPNPYFLKDTVLAGAKGASTSTVLPVLGVGSRNCSYVAPTNPSTLTAGTYSFPANEAQFKASDIFVMARGVSGAEAALLTDVFDSFATGSSVSPDHVAPLPLQLRAR